MNVSKFSFYVSLLTKYGIPLILSINEVISAVKKDKKEFKNGEQTKNF